MIYQGKLIQVRFHFTNGVDLPLLEEDKLELNRTYPHDYILFYKDTNKIKFIIPRINVEYIEFPNTQE